MSQAFGEAEGRGVAGSLWNRLQPKEELVEIVNVEILRIHHRGVSSGENQLLS